MKRNSTSTIFTGNRKHYTTNILKQPNESSNDVYIYTKRGDRLDLLAHKYYNDVSKWYIIALANNLGISSVYISESIQLLIPYNTN